MSNTMGVLSETGTAYPLRAHVFTPSLYWLVRVDNFCCAFFLRTVFYAMLPMSLYCSFLVAPSVFSNVYSSRMLCT
jgi:hypothetical protein